MTRLHRFVYLSLMAAFVTIALKWTAYALTGSVGFLSDAAESFVNLAAALIALFSVWYAAQPADAEHAYGHEKIEYFSSGLEGTLILVVAGGIAWYAVRRLIHPEPLEKLELGSLLALSASVVNFLVARVLIAVGRRSGSIALEADGKHLMTDVGTSVGVLAGVGLVAVTDLWWLDPVAALVVAGFIVHTGLDLVRRSYDGLMDRALPEEEQTKIRQAIEAELLPGMRYHALRTRRAGARRRADFHLLVPGIYTVRRGHEWAHRAEAAVRAVFPDLDVIVHVEPVEERGSYEETAPPEPLSATFPPPRTGESAPSPSASAAP